MNNKTHPVRMERLQDELEGQVVYLLGIMPRSGTNFLEEMVVQHPDIGRTPVLPEDFFFHNSHILNDYIEQVYYWWNTYAPEGYFDEGEKDILLKHIGYGMEKYLYNMSLPGVADAFMDGAEVSKTFRTTPKVRVARTPSVENLEMVPRMTNSKAVVIIRDGRSVVESGMRSFGWLFEDSVQRWARSAARIEEVTSKHPDQFLVVKYENFLDDKETVLRKVFDFMGIDAELYDYEQEIAVRGSSTFFDKNKGINWSATKPDKSFNPRDRWRHWNTGLIARFNWIAGEEMKKLGYELTDHGGGIWNMINPIQDAIWPLRNRMRDVARAVIPAEMRGRILWNRGVKYRETLGKNKKIAQTS